jgi:hypothetical protein
MFICLSLQSQKVTHKINNRHLLILTWKLGSLNFKHITSSMLSVIFKILIPCGVYDTRSEFQTWLEMVFQICQNQCDEAQKIILLLLKANNHLKVEPFIDF